MKRKTIVAIPLTRMCIYTKRHCYIAGPVLGILYSLSKALLAPDLTMIRMVSGKSTMHL